MYDKILVAVDQSPVSDRAVLAARDRAVGHWGKQQRWSIDAAIAGPARCHVRSAEGMRREAACEANVACCDTRNPADPRG